jgi:hypothetical protein
VNSIPAVDISFIDKVDRINEVLNPSGFERNEKEG